MWIFVILSLWFGQPQTAMAQVAVRTTAVLETTQAVAGPGWRSEQVQTYPDAPFVPGELLVGVQSDTLTAASLLSALNVTVLDTFDLAQSGGVDGNSELVGYRLQVPVGQELQMATLLVTEPGVAFAEPNWLARLATEVEILSTDEDTNEKEHPDAIVAASEQPFSVSDALYQHEQWYLQRMNASRAWALALSQPLRRIRVAVIDTGVDADHPDLQDRLAPGSNIAAPGNAPDDDNGHGTHIAGLIAAVLNNGAGIAGSAVQVQVVPYKVFRWIDNNYQAPSLDIATAIRAAADSGIQIINLSLEFGTRSDVVERAVNYADARGALVIGAAGNCRVADQQCPSPVSYPAKYDAVVAVAATTYSDVPGFYSAAGDEIEVAAPGGDTIWDITSTWPKSMAQNCDLNAYIVEAEAGYCGTLGTSMAAALVSGVAALTWSVNPDLDAEAVRSILRESASALNYPDERVGAGRVDANAAVRRALPSTIEIAQKNLHYTVALSGTAFIDSVPLKNASLAPIDWSVSPIGTTRWLTFTGALSGSVTYGRPSHISLLITPTYLITGTYRASFWVEGRRGDGSRVIQPVNVEVEIAQPVLPPALFLPVVSRLGDSNLLPETPFRWESISAAQKRYYGMTEQSSIGITLPFTVTLHGRSFVDARIYSDGFVVFPAGNINAGGANQCLDNTVWPQQAIYAWWADLNPGAPGSTVSTFLQDDDRFVIEFLNVPSTFGFPLGYVVSFQIVLYKDGAVRLNYRDVSGVDAQDTRATVGLTTQDGRFYNQVACHVNGSTVGELPHSNQSFLFRSEELF